MVRRVERTRHSYQEAFGRRQARSGRVVLSWYVVPLSPVAIRLAVPGVKPVVDVEVMAPPSTGEARVTTSVLQIRGGVRGERRGPAGSSGRSPVGLDGAW